MFRMTDNPRYCKNCSAQLSGEYCAACGQRDTEINIPVADLAAEFMDILPDLDKRIMRSVKPFLLKPGVLTLEYLSGKRKTFISPFKLYLFVSFLFFFTSSFLDRNSVSSLPENVVVAAEPKTQSERDSAFLSLSNERSNVTFTVQDSAEVHALFGRTMITALQKIKADPSLVFDKMVEHRPKLIFLLMPMFALLLKLLYIRSNVLYIKHLVFSFYMHSFLFFVFFIIDLLKLTGFSVLQSYSGVLNIVIPPYLYAGMVQAYGQTRWKTAVKMILLTGAYSMTFLIAITLSLFLIIAFYYL